MPAPDINTFEPSSNWEHYPLFTRIRDSIYSIPSHFTSATSIEGVDATDLQTLNSVLGATIESQVVATLNNLRPFWDPGGGYGTHGFYRQAQVFPDVLFKSDFNGQHIVLGIELKGWCLLSKEGVPNFRFTNSSASCAEADLLVVVPWALDKVLSGTPIVFKPFVVSARYAAEHRNYWWQQVRDTSTDSTIVSPVDVVPYPTDKRRAADRLVSDGGGNFGRLARTGLLDDYVEDAMTIRLAGISAGNRVSFLRRFRQ